jgi:hypothetical protein
MAETDFIPIYGQSDPSLRPAYVARQSGAGYRAPGFIGRGLAGAQPQAAPQQGATSSGDAMAAMRGLYAARAEDGGFGPDNRDGGTRGGQQPTREAQSFQDLLASGALGLIGLSGPGGFASVMNTADRMGYDRNVNGPVTWGDVGAAMNPFGGNSVIGRAANAAYRSVTGSGPDMTRAGGFDPVTGVAHGERAMGIDRSVTSEPLAPPSGAGEGGASGGVPGFDPVTGMAPGEQSLGIDRSVQSSELSEVGGGTAVNDSGALQGGGGQGFEWRKGGPIGKPGAQPRPVTIKAHTGEFVQRPEAVNKYGPSAMAALNSLRAPAAAVKKAATKAPPSRGKGHEKNGRASDALARMKVRR